VEYPVAGDLSLSFGVRCWWRWW